MGVGLIVLLVLQRRFDRRRLVLLLVPLAALTFFTFKSLPEDAQLRTLNFTAGTQSRGAYAIKIRQEYATDAGAIIRANPVFGIGVGRYLAGTPSAGTETTDPHDVLLLQAAEGGYPLGVSFVVLIVGTVAVLAIRARGTSLGPLAAAATLAVVSHGLVDVYWVRATPVMAWMLVGMALGGLAGERAQKVGGDDPAGPCGDRGVPRRLDVGREPRAPSRVDSMSLSSTTHPTPTCAPWSNGTVAATSTAVRTAVSPLA